MLIDLVVLGTMSESDIHLFDFSTNFADSCLHCVALIIYEFVVTLDTEVRLFWGRKITGASVVFFLNRYTMLCYAIVSLWQFLPVANSASVSLDMSQLSNTYSSNP